MKRYLLKLILLLISFAGHSQGYNHQWLIGDQWLLSVPKARISFDTAAYILQTEYRKMSFEGTEANICDSHGNFIMSSNGVWIANANNDTMLNGSGLNPGPEVSSSPHGLLLIYANIFLPYPGDSTKIALIHHAADANGISYSAFDIFITIVDMTLDGGLGGVSSKNNFILSDTLNQGIAACKHANGRDWWIVVQQDNSDTIFKMLLTPNGIVSNNAQKLNVPIARFNVTQLTFSSDGTKFSYYRYDPVTLDEYVLIFDFDRCTGMFSNERIVPITLNTYLWGLAFSPSGKYIYACSSINIFQIDIDSLTVETVATYDGFYSGAPPTCCATTFFNMYLAANGKIYITSGNGVQHLHEMNYPDSSRISCDVQQHAINLGIWNFRAVPNHPNYYLGPLVGSVCDSLTDINDHLNEINNFQVKPNPNNGNFSISYLLPQNKPGLFEVYDVNGRKVYKMPLPQWSTLQQIKLPKLAEGLYNAVITSAGFRVGKKIAVIGD